MSTQETLDALDEAGRLLAPILQAETADAMFSGSPSVYVRGGKFRLFDSIYFTGGGSVHVAGEGDSLSAAFVQFLADRSDKLAERERDERLKREFEAFKAQQVAA